MRSYAIVTDSSCDMTAEMADALGVTVVPLILNLGDRSYLNYLDGREISCEEVYRQLRTTVKASTAAPNVESYEQVIEPYLRDGRDVLILSFSSALSSTCANSIAAAQSLAERYPDRALRVVDTRCASLGQGLLVYTCAKLAEEGKTLEEVYAFATENLSKLNHWFTCDSLQRLRLGGRISATTALFGGLLSIKPIMHVDDEGRLINVTKTRGRQASIAELADRVASGIVNPKAQTIFISHGDCLEDAQKLKAKILEKITVKGFEINFVGPVIGAHAGPGVLAVFFYGNHR